MKASPSHPQPCPTGSQGAEKKRHLHGGLARSLIDFFIICVCFFATWQLRAFSAQSHKFTEKISENDVSKLSRGVWLHREALIADIRMHAPARIVDKCVAMVKGDTMDSFAQGKQDWVLYHTFFSHMNYGEGFYIDAGANDPEIGSNTFFFDACLGWQGICFEPNPAYVEGFKVKRTCKHFRNCLSSKEGQMILVDAQKGTKGFVKENGTGLTVLCKRLEDILTDEGVGQVELGQRKVDLVSLDIEGQEYNSLKCFPFDAFDMPIWLIETRNQAGYSLNGLMGSAGYWMSPAINVPWSKNLPPYLGARQDNIFVRWKRPKSNSADDVSTKNFTSGHFYQNLVPPLILGPDFLPGSILEGASFLPPCTGKLGCPASVPSIDLDLEYKHSKFVGGECPPHAGRRHRLSRKL